MPARPHSAATFDACTSDPPASGSSRSRHARIAMRRKPAPAAMSPSFATTSSLPDPVPGTGRNLRVPTPPFRVHPSTRDGPLRSLGGKGGPWPGSPASARWRVRPPTRCSRCTMPATARSRRGSGPGVVLDVGCGVGDQTARLAGADRLVLGADYSAPTVVETGRAHAPTRSCASRAWTARASACATGRSTRWCRPTSSSTS